MILSGCFQQGLQYYENQVTETLTGISSPEECQEHCLKSACCTWWTYSGGVIKGDFNILII